MKRRRRRPDQTRRTCIWSLFAKIPAAMLCTGASPQRWREGSKSASVTTMQEGIKQKEMEEG
jgi:hypothetical protein